ncbi:MAG: hypothetical protein DRI95_01565 [Bacteroidetes bacterium]|nr:MAG: hypothetical protein DRI95_01565 [Bacteroidota bacterium]RLD81537.1 MAG: hypothetical protein DRJ07_09155 [Bacteroidota bacterium]
MVSYFLYNLIVNSWYYFVFAKFNKVLINNIALDLFTNCYFKNKGIACSLYYYYNFKYKKDDESFY